MIGCTIGRYRIIAKLGEGGMGSVWKAEDTLLGRSVALKFLPEALAASPEARRRFLREARAASALDHPGIATVFDAAEADGHIYIAFPVIEGETLTERLRRGPIRMAEAVRITLRAAEAIAHAHARGVLHRDITSGNIMVTPEGRVVVVDFGLALPEGTTRLTATSTVMGTVGYMAPEVVQGHEGDRRADLYGLGVVLYELLTGRMPFEGAQREAVLYRVVHEEAQAPSALRSAVPEELDRITLKALAKEPKHRYQNASQLIEELAMLEKGGALERLDAAEVTPVLLTPWGRWTRWVESLIRRSRRAASSRAARRRTARVIATAGAIVALAIGVALVMARFRLGPFAHAPRFTSVAVLPFKNASADPVESARFVDGINEELTARLVKLEGLRVVPWQTSQRFRPAELSLTEIARRLHVDALVVGTFHKQGDRIRTTIGLVSGRDGFQRWSDEFEESLSDIFTVQRNIAAAVATQLKGQLSGTEQEILSTPAAQSVEAYDHYLSGAEALSVGDRVRTGDAIEHFQKAVEIDPKLAEAHVGIGAVYTRRYFQGWEGSRALVLAEASFRRALELKPNLGTAQRGLIRVYWERDLSEECLKIGKAAAVRGWNDIDALLTRGHAYFLGRLPEKAVPVFEHVLELDPENQDALWHLTISRAWACLYAQALAAGQEYIRKFDEDPEIRTWIACSHQALGAFEDARRDYEIALQTFGDAPNDYIRFHQGLLYRRLGQERKARQIWAIAVLENERALATDPDNEHIKGGLCQLYAVLGEREKFWICARPIGQAWWLVPFFPHPEIISRILADSLAANPQIESGLPLSLQNMYFTLAHADTTSLFAIPAFRDARQRSIAENRDLSSRY